MRDPAPARDRIDDIAAAVTEVLALMSQEAVLPAGALPAQRFEWVSPWWGGAVVRVKWDPPPVKGHKGRLTVELLQDGSFMVWRTQVNVTLVELDG